MGPAPKLPLLRSSASGAIIQVSNSAHGIAQRRPTHRWSVSTNRLVLVAIVVVMVLAHVEGLKAPGTGKDGRKGRRTSTRPKEACHTTVYMMFERAWTPVIGVIPPRQRTADTYFLATGEGPARTLLILSSPRIDALVVIDTIVLVAISIVKNTFAVGHLANLLGRAISVSRIVVRSLLQPPMMPTARQT